MNDVVAVITLDLKNRKIADLELRQEALRFSCKRCAALCCKLGGPVLTRKETEAIRDTGYQVNDFLEPVNRDTKGLSLAYGGLKTREDGSCIFIQQDIEQNIFKCGIYDVRPALCRLYPFSFEKLGANRISLKFIPCCLGLNNPEGEVLDKEFISNRLLEPLLDAIELLHKGELF